MQQLLNSAGSNFKVAYLNNHQAGVRLVQFPLFISALISAYQS